MDERREQPDIPAGSTREGAGDEAGKPKVLIVDDDGATRRLCADYCDLFDHPSQAVRSAHDAVDALRRERFDVVVLSVGMGDTLDALRAIRALPAPSCEAPIIGLTPIGRGEETQRWMAAGLAAVLAKPVTARRLFGALASVLSSDPDGARSWAPA
jgi:CheY-like chemotaxis protein